MNSRSKCYEQTIDIDPCRQQSQTNYYQNSYNTLKVGAGEKKEGKEIKKLQYDHNVD